MSDGRWQRWQSWWMWQPAFRKLWRPLGTPSSESLSLRHGRIHELRAVGWAPRAMIFLKSLSPRFPSASPRDIDRPDVQNLRFQMTANIQIRPRSDGTAVLWNQ